MDNCSPLNYGYCYNQLIWRSLQDVEKLLTDNNN